MGNLFVKGVNQVQGPDFQMKLASRGIPVSASLQERGNDSVDLSYKTFEPKEEKKKNGFKGKKILIAIGLTLATVIGGATLGNKLSNKTAMLGAAFDAKWAQTSIYKAISGFFTNAKNRIAGVLKKSKTMTDIMDTMKNRFSKPVWDFARGYGRGFKSIFALTPPDTIDKAFKQNGITTVEQGVAMLRNVVGKTTTKDGKEIAKVLAESIFSDPRNNKFVKLDNVKFCDLLSDGVRAFTGAGQDHVKFVEALTNLQKGIVNGKKAALGFTNITMGDKGLHPIGNWWPVNFVQKIGKKFNIKGMENFCKGNLGDSLIKYNAVNGSLSNSRLGALIQQSVTVPTESITNFVNDKSGMGAFLCCSIYGLYNNVQDAPKGKKTATIADDYVGTIGSIAVATPLASATAYGLASLRNLEGKTVLSKVLKPIGKLFGMGLDSVAKDGTITKCSNKFVGFLGGVGRLGLILFVLMPQFQKPIRGVIHKIFGKPYDKEEEEAAKMQKMQMASQGRVLPEFGMTQQELITKLQQHPEVIEKIQKNPKLLAAIQKNPELLMDVVLRLNT